MVNRLYFKAEDTHKAEILQTPGTKNEAKAAGCWRITLAPNTHGKKMIRQQLTTKSTKAPTSKLKSALHKDKDGSYSTKAHTISRCPKDLGINAERGMTEYEEDETPLPSETVDLTKASAKTIAVSSNKNFKNDPFALPITHLRAP